MVYTLYCWGMEHTNAAKIGVAVRKGQFQAQRISYDAKGKSTVEPISGWTTAGEATKIAKEHGFVPYWER